MIITLTNLCRVGPWEPRLFSSPSLGVTRREEPERICNREKYSDTLLSTTSFGHQSGNTDSGSVRKCYLEKARRTRTIGPHTYRVWAEARFSDAPSLYPLLLPRSLLYTRVKNRLHKKSEKLSP